MTPIDEDNILFLGGPDPTFGNRKGMTVSKIESGKNQGEIRIAIWTFIHVPGTGGYITPRKGGISLTTAEFCNLMENGNWANDKIQNLRQENLNTLIEAIEKVEDIEELQRKLDAAKRALSPSTGPANACPAAQGKPSTSAIHIQGKVAKPPRRKGSHQ